jgi:hypothetical protein
MADKRKPAPKKAPVPTDPAPKAAAKPKLKPEKEVIEKLYALEDELQAEITSHPSDFVRVALVNIRGEISHLHDAERVAHAMREKAR